MPMHRSRGFTLLELLVVVFIIGVIVTFAVLSISGGSQDDALRKEAQRIQALLQLASDTAIMQGQSIGFVCDGKRYGFLVRNEAGVWEPTPDDTPLRNRDLPGGIHLKIELDGFKLPEPVAADKPRLKPQIFLFSTQELSPFTIHLSAEGTPLKLRIVGEPGGNILLLYPGEKASDLLQRINPELQDG